MIWLFYILKWTGIYKNVKKTMNWNRYHIEQIQLDYTCTSITEKNDTASKQFISDFFICL